MALQVKPLKGVAGKLFTPNSIKNGGLTSLVVPYTLTKTGLGVAAGGLATYGLIKEGISERNVKSLGKVSYGGGPARMTSNFTSGGIEAMARVSGGNMQAFNEMASDAMSNGIGLYSKLDTYGATPELVSALYGMGG